MQRLEQVSATAGTNDGPATDFAQTQTSGMDLTQNAESAQQPGLKASTQKLAFSSEAKMANQREVDRLARKEKRRNERLMKHDWRVIEKRRINDFEKSAKDKRIEEMVKKVDKMTSEQVEMELNLEELGIRAGKAAQYEPASSGTSDGGSSHRRILVREMGTTGGEEADGDRRRSIIAIKDVETGEASYEQDKLFLTAEARLWNATIWSPRHPPAESRRRTEGRRAHSGRGKSKD